jgi:Ca-activated chloride channel family protein
MRFLRPELAIWFLGLPVAFGAWYLHVYAKRRFRTRAGIGRRLSRISSSGRDALALTAALVAVAALTFAMMRPQLLIQHREPEYEREDLVIMLDRSISMHAEDIAPSRFQRAVHEIKNFLASKPDAIDRVGLVGFAGNALIVSHLTSDLNSLFFYLDWINEDIQPQFGTDLGAALSSARDLARKDNRQTRKVFLILSDGDEQGQQLSVALAAMRADQVPVYTIGIGSEAEVPIPLSKEGGVVTYLQDDEGRMVHTKFNEATLRGIATVTGGQYYRSTTGSELSEAMRGMAARERKIVGYKTTTDYRDLYRQSLALGAACALLVLVTL